MILELNVPLGVLCTTNYSREAMVQGSSCFQPVPLHHPTPNTYHSLTFHLTRLEPITCVCVCACVCMASFLPFSPHLITPGKDETLLKSNYPSILPLDQSNKKWIKKNVQPSNSSHFKSMATNLKWAISTVQHSKVD